MCSKAYPMHTGCKTVGKHAESIQHKLSVLQLFYLPLRVMGSHDCDHLLSTWIMSHWIIAQTAWFNQQDGVLSNG